MNTDRMIMDSFRREIILEVLEERIVLDAAVNPVDSVDLTDAEVGHDPVDGEWTWEHGAWCYRDGSTEWWWWPDASSPQSGNWLYRDTSWSGMYHYDWNDGWEWFFDSFWNDRYFQDSGLYWGQDGRHDWYFTEDPNDDWDFTTWNALGRLDGDVLVNFDPAGSGGRCYNPGAPSWVPYGSLVWVAVEPVLVADIYPGSNDSYISDPTAFNNNLYFGAWDDYSGSFGHELWTYHTGDDTATIITDLNPGPSNSTPSGLIVFDGDLYFCADNDEVGRELWYYDPDTETVYLAIDLVTGAGSSDPQYLTVFDGDLYFQVQGSDIYRADPVAHTVSLVGNVNIERDITAWDPLVVFDGDLYYATYGAVGRYDPVSDSFTIVAEMPNSSPPEPTVMTQYLTVVGDNLYFYYPQGSQPGIWQYDPDGGAGGVATWLWGPDASYLTEFEGDLYFDGGDGIYRYDPDTDQTVQVIEGVTGSWLTVYNDDLYFAGTPVSGSEPIPSDEIRRLWVYDPDTGLAEQVSDSAWMLEDLTVCGGVLYFVGEDVAHGSELWGYAASPG